MLFGMDPITGIVAGLSGLKTASDLATRIREALGSREVKLDEVVPRIIEIQGLISDGRTALIDMQEQLLDKNKEIARLDQECTALKAQLAKKQQGRIHDNAAWKVLDDGSEEGPYCVNCYETTGNFIQPVRGATHPTIVYFWCNEHNKQFLFTVPVELCGPKLPEKRPRPSTNIKLGPWS